MTTDPQTAADWLAINLMGWVPDTETGYLKYEDAGWVYFNGNLLSLSTWQPYLPTSQGLFQCLGPGGVEEAMWKRGFYLTSGRDPLTGKQSASFWFEGERRGRAIEETKTAATVLAARAALERKEENNVSS